MSRVMVSGLAGHVGRRVTMAGWGHHQRHLANVSFLLLRDATGIAQVVIDDGATRAAAEAIVAETVVAIEATVEAIARIRAAGSEVTSVRRLPPPV